MRYFELSFINTPMLLVEPRSGCETIVLRVYVCLCVCVPANFQYIEVQLNMRVDTP